MSESNNSNPSSSNQSAAPNRVGDGATAAPPVPATADIQNGAGGVSNVQQFQIREGGFTADQERTLASWMVQEGKLSHEQANQMLSEGGLEPLPDPAEKSTNSIAEEIDKAFPPAKPEQYDFQLIGPDDEYTPKIAAFDKQVRDILSTGRFPREIGNFVADEISQTATRTHAMTDAQRAIWEQNERLTLERMWGPEKMQQRLALAQQLVQEVDKKHPGLVELLETTGAGNSSMVVMQVALHAERLLDRLSGNSGESKQSSSQFRVRETLGEK
jgi:hypothetical protein